jgi:hypothetical protein
MKNHPTETKRRQSLTKEEEAICEFQKTKGKKKWTELFLPSKTAKQIRERWNHVLNSAVSKKPWTLEEDSNLLEKVREVGKKWNFLQQFFSGRTDVILKNRYQLLERHKQTQKNVKYDELTSNEVEEVEELNFDLEQNGIPYEFSYNWLEESTLL